MISACEGTPITWNAGFDVTRQKRKSKPAEGKKATTMMVRCESFFNFFDSITVDSNVPAANDAAKQLLDDL